ncbi:MAG: tRNA (guanosine(37)-N1)-methyltransferase TrmD [bacterium]|nr:tRNA (guanosine(37)-N1)-methyltransferase TrmD [bacterium]
MRIDVITLFPPMVEGVLGASMMKRADERELVRFHVHDLRDQASDRHRTADDRPFGGGAGMVIKPEIVFSAVEALPLDPGARIIMTCPQGTVFRQRHAEELAAASHLVFLCGHYEGFDERVREHLVTDVYSIGDYVLTNGELPALVMIDAIVRLLPGVVGKEQSTREDSFSTGLLDHPHYTRPVSFRGWEVPDILRSGDHARIQAWRREQALRRTLALRPDLLEHAPLDRRDRQFLASLGWMPPPIA